MNLETDCYPVRSVDGQTELVTSWWQSETMSRESTYNGLAQGNHQLASDRCVPC